MIFINSIGNKPAKYFQTWKSGTAFTIIEGVIAAKIKVASINPALLTQYT